jgi:recombination protein RecT
MMTSAQLGLEIGVMGQGYVVPYWNNKKSTYEAQFIPGYKGLIALARRSGEVLSIETHIVYEKDKFDMSLGIDAKLEHRPEFLGDRGKPVLVYGVAKFRDGGHHLEWMTIGEVFRIRDRNASKNREGQVVGPWVNDTDQMIRKTLIRRMANYLPMSIEFANALTLDEAAEAGKSATLDGDFVNVEEGSDDVPLVDATTEPGKAITFTQVQAQIEKATAEDTLDLAADLVRNITDAGERKELADLVGQKRAQLAAGAKQ